MTMIRNTADIKSFVKETLGCRCPESVFEQLDYDVQATISGLDIPLQRLLIGNRLLIYMVESDDAAALKIVLPLLVAKGKADRDINGYNRLRVVVAADQPESFHREAEALFSSLESVDENVHLHVLTRAHSLARLLRAVPSGIHPLDGPQAASEEKFS